MKNKHLKFLLVAVTHVMVLSLCANGLTYHHKSALPKLLAADSAVTLDGTWMDMTNTSNTIIFSDDGYFNQSYPLDGSGKGTYTFKHNKGWLIYNDGRRLKLRFDAETNQLAVFVFNGKPTMFKRQ